MKITQFDIDKVILSFEFDVIREALDDLYFPTDFEEFEKELKEYILIDKIILLEELLTVFALPEMKEVEKFYETGKTNMEHTKQFKNDIKKDDKVNELFKKLR